MSEDNREDLLHIDLESAFISLIPNKIRAIVIGGGRAGFIKASSLSKKGYRVTVVSKAFCEDFKKLEAIENLKLIADSYKVKYIKDKHIVVIATKDKDISDRIKSHCDKLNKIYIYCSDFKNGLGALPYSDNTKNIYFAINTKGGNPKASKFLSRVIKDRLENYDQWIGYITSLRESLIGNAKKDEIMEFVASEDFKFFYDKNVHDYILRMFYGGELY